MLTPQNRAHASLRMPQTSNYSQTEAVRWRLLVENLYEDAGIVFPFSSSVPWQTYVRGILAVWGGQTQGPEGTLIKNLAKELNEEYGLGATINMQGQPSEALYAVAFAASGECRCPGRGIYESLGSLIDWSAIPNPSLVRISGAGFAPVNASLNPNGVLNGKAAYVNGLVSLYWDGSLWNIAYNTGTGDVIAYQSASDTEYPWQATWDMGPAAEPFPTVTELS